MLRTIAVALLCLIAPALQAQSLVVPDQAGTINTAGQSFVIQFTPGADSGGLGFTLAASPAANLTITGVVPSIPHGLTTCDFSASSVTCSSQAVSPANDLGAGTITVTYTAAGRAGPIALAFSNPEFYDQDGLPEPGTATGGTLTLPRGPQAPFTAAASPASLVFGGSSVLSSSGGSGTGAVAYAVTAGGSVCAVSGSSLTAIGVGTCTVTATRAGDADYLPAGASVTVSVARAAQAAFALAATPSALVLGDTSALSTSGGSGSGAVSYAITTGAAVCAISGSTLTAIGVGQCTVVASKAGDAHYEAASASVVLAVEPPPTAQSLRVPEQSGQIHLAGQTLVVEYLPGNDSGGFDFALAASPAGRITFTGASASIPNGSANCTTSAAGVSCAVAASVPGNNLGAGTVTLTYTGGSQHGSVALAFTAANFFRRSGASGSGTTTNGSLLLDRATQAPLAVTASPASLAFGGSSALGTSGGSGSGAVSYAVTAGASVCAVSGSTLSAVGVGLCTITATKAADADFNAASATRLVEVVRAVQAPLAANASPATIFRGGSSALSTTGGSGAGAVTWAVTSGGAVCTVSGATLTGSGVGQCTVTATKAGTATWEPASASVQVTVNSLPSNQSLAVPNQAGVLNTSGQTFVIEYIPGQDSGGFDFDLRASPAGRITINAASTSIPNASAACSRGDSSVVCVVTALTPSADLGAGTITVTYSSGAAAGPVALQFLDANFFDQNGAVETGTTTNGTLSLPFLPQAPLAVSATPASLPFGASAGLSTSGGSGAGAVSYAVTAGAAACVVNGSTLTAIGVGTCTITASKAGDATYAAATASASVTVTRAPQAAFAVAAAPTSVPFGGSSALSTSGGSGTGVVTYAIGAGAAHCTLTGSTLRATGVGSCTVVASKAGDAQYEPASASVSITVENTPPTLSAPASVATLEDLAAAPIAIGVQDAETAPGALVLSATSSNQALVSDAALAAGFGGSGANRSLVVAPAVDANGSATITVMVSDAHGASSSRAITLQVDPVNDAPQVLVPSNLNTVPGASGAQLRPGFVTSLVLGPADEQASQALLGYTVTELDDPAGAVSAVALSNDGTLSFSTSGVAGIARFALVATDSGGTANGGVAASAPREFAITVPLATDLEVAIDNARNNLLPGDVVSYTVLVANAGPNAVADAAFRFAVPAGLSAASWTCEVATIGACSATEGTGDIEHAVALPVGGVLRFVLSASVTGPLGTSIAASASITAPKGYIDTDPLDDLAVDSDPVVGDLVLDDGFEPGAAISVAVPATTSRD